MPGSPSETKKLDANWERKVSNSVYPASIQYQLKDIDEKILECNDAICRAGLGGISYDTSQASEIDRQAEAIGTLNEYVARLRESLNQQLDNPLFDSFNKKATETLSRVHPDQFQTANTIGLKNSYPNSDSLVPDSFEQKKDHLDLYDFLGYNAENYSGVGCEFIEKSGHVQDFANIFKADYDDMKKEGALNGTDIKCLDDYLKDLVNGGEFNHQMYQPFKSFLSGLLDITIVKPLVDACTGYDCITGEDLSDTERALDVLFAGVSLIPVAGAAGKAAEIGGKEGALFFGKTIAVDAASYAASYSVGTIANQAGVPPQLTILLSLGVGVTATKVAGKYILKNAEGVVIKQFNEDGTIDYIGLSKNLGEKLNTDGYKILSTETAEQANADWADIGYDKPPVAVGTKVYNVEAGNHSYSRVYYEGYNYPKSRFILRTEDIEGLSAKEIAIKYALPKVPNKIVNVKLPETAPLEVSIVGPQEDWGTIGGDAQYVIKDVDLDDQWFYDIKDLK